MNEQWNPEIWSPNQASRSIIDIEARMGQLGKVAEAYANATPEQRAQIDPSLVQSVLDEYNQLKAERNQLANERAYNELLYHRQQAEQQAALQRAALGRGRTFAPRGPLGTGNVTIAFTKTWVPYYLDNTTWLQTAPIASMTDGTMKVVDSLWNATYLPDISWDINWWINRYGENAALARDYEAAYDNAEAVRNTNIAANMMAVPWAMTLAELMVAGWAAGWAGALAEWGLGNWVSNGVRTTLWNGGGNYVNWVREALNNWYRGVQSSPTYTSLQYNPVRNITRVDEWALAEALNNGYNAVKSSINYGDLATNWGAPRLIRYWASL